MEQTINNTSKCSMFDTILYEQG